MLESLLKAFEAGLSLWDSKEKTKYRDRLLELRKSWYEEINKPDAQRDNSVLDNLEFELRSLADSFASQVGKQSS